MARMRHWSDILLGAVQLALLLIPAFFLNDLLSVKMNAVLVNLVVIPLLTGLCACAAIISHSVKTALLKWLFSIPLGFCFWRFLIAVEFHARGLNWILPGYGESSAGGNFAGFMLLCSTVCIHLICVIAGVSFSQQKQKDFRWLPALKILSAVVSVSIGAAVLVLNAKMP